MTGPAGIGPEQRRFILPVITENVPEQLKQHDQWLNWEGVWDETKKKLNKIPKQSDGKAGSSTNEKTWTPFDKAVQATRQREDLDGIGFAGLGRTSYSGIDIDHCIDPETGEISPYAMGLVREFNSYTERTVSNTGLRIWVEAEKSLGSWCGSKNAQRELEVYTTGRYFTVTGQHLEGTPRTIEPRQEIFDAFMEREAPPEKPRIEHRPYNGPSDYRLELTEFLQEFGVTIQKAINDQSSERAYAIVCPWAHEHTGGDKSGTRVGQYSSGALWFKCDHAHCDGREWEHFREELDPEAYRTYKITFGKRSKTPEEEAAEKREEAKEAWESCADLARDKDILGRFVREQHAAGVVGEEGIMKLLYLSITSRLLSRPASVVVKGPSSGGKTYTTEQTLKAFPKNAYHDFSGMSEKALIYTDKDFRHKFIYVPEAAGVNNEFLDYILRTLLSEHRIKYITVEQQGGKNVPREIIKEGPTGLLMTTTRAKLHPENETRLLSLTVNDTREQTRAVMRSIAQRDNRSAKDYSKWHALQTWIEGQDNRVVVPYGELLAEKIPPIDMRIRRDFELLLNTIHTHAIIHQANRERDKSGRIVATIEDYTVVRELVNDVMSTGVQARVGEDLRRVVKAVEKMLDDDIKPSVRKLEQKLDMSKSVIQRHLRVAMSEGYLVAAKEDNAGRVKEYGIGAEIPEDTDLLPSVEELAVPLSGLSQEGPQGGGKEDSQLSHGDLGQSGTVGEEHAVTEEFSRSNRQQSPQNKPETSETVVPPGTVRTVGQQESDPPAGAPGTVDGTVGGTVETALEGDLDTGGMEETDCAHGVPWDLPCDDCGVEVIGSEK